MTKQISALAAYIAVASACAETRRPPQTPKEGCGTAAECYVAALAVFEDARKAWELERQSLLRRTEEAIPIGTVVAFAGEDLPKAGWLPCDGQEYAIAKYPRLSALLGSTYGKAVKAEHFIVPDYQGYFLRAWDPKKQRDPSDSRAAVSGGTLGPWGVGGVQSDLVGSHTHPVPLPFEERSGGPETVAWVNFNVVGRIRKYTVTDGSGGAETRPKNVAVIYLIRADYDQ